MNRSDQLSTLRERVLDATEMSVERYGVNKITMDDVASLAKVSRGSVYKHFGSKDGLILAMLVRRAERFNVRARTFLEAQPNLQEARGRQPRRMVGGS